MSETHKAIIRRIREEIVPSNALAQLDDLYTEDYVLHRRLLGDLSGRSAYRSVAEPFVAGLPDYHEVVLDQFAEGDKVVTRYGGSGTHKAMLYGVPPTGNTITWTGITITRFAGDKIAEEWVEGDSLAFMSQLGAKLQFAQPV